MTPKENILQELNELKSSLAGITPQNVYTVPDGYFDGLMTQVSNRIKAMEAKNAEEELNYLSPALSRLFRQVHDRPGYAGGPYSIPSGYFEGLAEEMAPIVVLSKHDKKASEELEGLSPLLSDLKKTMLSRPELAGGPYTVPEGYFDNPGVRRTKPAGKIVSFTHRKWYRFAAAAVMTGVVVLGGFIYLNSRKVVDPVAEPYLWVKKSIKKVDKADIDSFVKLADENFLDEDAVAVSPVKPGEINELMKDVSDQEIQEFLDATPDTEPNEEIMVN